MDYEQFLKSKQVYDTPAGIQNVPPLKESLFDFQRDVVSWACRRGRDKDDEQHISPLQLDVIERCIHLWSNPNDVVFTPFLGIGSEVYGAVEMGRRGIGIELKATYFSQAVKNLEKIKDRTKDLL